MQDIISTLFGEVPIDKEYEWKWVEEHFEPLKTLYLDEFVTEIFVDRFDAVSIERNGRIEKTDIRFESNDHFQTFIKQLSTALNQTLTPQSPILDARLPDCSRVCATLADVTPQGATMTMRIAPKTLISAEQLIEYRALTREMLDYLITAIQEGKNIIVSGNTGSGKTTLLRALARYIPEQERVVTCEDTQELYLDWLPFKVSMESPKREDSDVEMKTLIEASLRMRPDRIWVGEIRKASAADAFLQAINTGHSGCMTTIHSNGCQDALSRLQYLIASQGQISFDLAKQQIIGNVDIFVHASRHESYGRKITEIAEVVNGVVTPKYIFDKAQLQHVSSKEE
ncbi:type II secretion system protein E [Vibrio mediterranei AK1]|uniref:CpaF family protein n=1 Tax=Vibrio mediterranei TaxID=689 RepID=UPI0001542813|nr:ATPase, T2SS/T4P/T4SS family [Vibrio mediterranei]EDL52176.1 type II secretion system protein E [Vibrio mediterranei AK1]